MKKSILCLLSLISTVSTIYCKFSWTPYYAFNFSEGVYLPSVGKWGFSTNLSSDLGVIIKPSEKHSALVFYELNYTGPGLKRQEGEKFEQRNMSHIFMAQYSFKYSQKITFKTRINYITDWWRSGTNELWGFGVYDSLRMGISETVNFQIKEFLFSTQIGFNQLKFPNYTDLITEYMSGTEETVAGKQDNNLYQFNTKVNYKGHNAGLNFNYQSYPNQKILDETGTYTDTKQTDLSLEFFYEKEVLKIIGPLWSSPYFSVKLKDSNQGYLHFKTVTSTPTFVADFYDYTKLTFSLPVNVNITKTKYISVIPEYTITNYTRPARNENNDFISDKHNLYLTVLTFAYTSQPDENRKMTLFYSYQTQTSTTKFDKYFPYNYSGHYFGIKYGYTF